jgi:carbon-monoxide dehydrogenase large subunit
MLRRWICKYALNIPEHKLRVIAPDVGGGFGNKVNFHVEVSTIVWMSRELGRPVKWTATRSETLQSDTQARDHATWAFGGLWPKTRECRRRGNIRGNKSGTSRRSARDAATACGRRRGVG